MILLAASFCPLSGLLPFPLCTFSGPLRPALLPQKIRLALLEKQNGLLSADLNTAFSAVSTLALVVYMNDLSAAWALSRYSCHRKSFLYLVYISSVPQLQQ